MKVFAATGNTQVAKVYLADFGEGRTIEFVESLQPPYSRDEKWILMVSTLFGCPVQCLICDAGGSYLGKLTKDQMLMQIDYLVRQYYPDMNIPASKFKIQFARMGEPALNMEVLDVLEELSGRYNAPGLMPSVSTVAPHSASRFFDRLLEIKNRLYSGGRFQFQFSIHTTDEAMRDRLVPVKKWSFSQMAEYGRTFYRPGDRKITLNFALGAGMPLDSHVLLKYFDPDRYLIKITPVNPTCRAAQHGIGSHVDPARPDSAEGLVYSLGAAGYDVIVSIGEVEENLIGSNCGQYVLRFIKGEMPVKDGYTYDLERINL